jgi:hypothetical protein
MALSRRRTTVAALRGILGPVYGQEQRFAKLVGRSVSWVKKSRLSIIPLGEDTAGSSVMKPVCRSGGCWEALIGGLWRGTKMSRIPGYFAWYRTEHQKGRPVDSALTPLTSCYNYLALVLLPEKRKSTLHGG